MIVASAVVWYMAASPSQIDTIEYCYLEGQDGVFLETRQGFNVDGMEIKARLDFAAKAIDWPAVRDIGSAFLAQVVDDGVGISEEAVRDARSLGIIGIRERVQRLEGTLTIEQRPEGRARGLHVPLLRVGEQRPRDRDPEADQVGHRPPRQAGARPPLAISACTGARP